MASITPYNQTLGTRNAAHLLRRATLGATKQQIDQFAQRSAVTAVTQLLTTTPAPPPPVDPATGQAWVNPKPTEANSPGSELQRHLNGWWLHQMATNPLSAQEKMTFFLHTHFTTIADRVGQKPAIYYQMKLFHHYALGNIKTLAKKICVDNAMLKFLDGHLNEVGNPNENFAREFLELYSVGKGPQLGPDNYTNYTEQDVREAAKVFSGWKEDAEFTNLDADRVAQALLKGDDSSIAARHDASTKQFSAAFQNRTISPSEMIDEKATRSAALDEIDQLVEMVFAQPETARHLCRKLYRYLIYYEITDQVEQHFIEPLARICISNNYELRPVLQALLTSQHFYDHDNATTEDDNTGAIIKSPLDLTIGTLRFFQVTLPPPSGDLTTHYQAYKRAVLDRLDDQGLHLYEPFEVAGYPAYHQSPAYHRNWISANYLARRYEFAKKLIEGIRDNDNQLLAHLDVVAYVSNTNNISDPFDAPLLVRELTDYLLPEVISEERFTYFLKTILLDDLSETNWQTEWQKYLGSGNDAAVRVQLEKLFNTILQSPEYQLS